MVLFMGYLDLEVAKIVSFFLQKVFAICLQQQRGVVSAFLRRVAASQKINYFNEKRISN